MHLRLLAFAKALVLASSLSMPGVASDACTLQDVLLARAAIHEDSVAFTQVRRIHYVSEPAESSGRLRYAAPAHLEMLVDEPRQERFVYDEGVLTIKETDTGAEKQVSIEANVVLSAMLSGLIGILSGDESALQQMFFVDFEDQRCRWQLRLVPRSKRVLEKIDEINVVGERQRIGKVEILQPNGDTSILTIKDQ